MVSWNIHSGLASPRFLEDGRLLEIGVRIASIPVFFLLLIFFQGQHDLGGSAGLRYSVRDHSRVWDQFEKSKERECDGSVRVATCPSKQPSWADWSAEWWSQHGQPTQPAASLSTAATLLLLHQENPLLYVGDIFIQCLHLTYSTQQVINIFHTWEWCKSEKKTFFLGRPISPLIIFFQ